MNKKQSIKTILKSYLGKRYKFFPKWLLDDITTFDGHKEKLDKATFEIKRSQEKLLKETMDIGNEQRGQSTSQILSPTHPSKPYWDAVIYSAVCGNVESGPLLSVVAGYKDPFYSDYLHRRLLFEKLVNDEWIISTNPESKFSKFFDTKEKEIIDKPFSEWDTEHKNGFLETEIPSTVNVYGHSELNINQQNKSDDFAQRNDRMDALQRVHSIESSNNRHSKINSGIRFDDYNVNKKTGEVTVKESWEHNKIRENSILPLIRHKNMKDIKSVGRGYDKNFQRKLHTGYVFKHQSWINLDVYKLFHEMKYLWDKIDYKSDKILEKNFVDVSWTDIDFIKWTRDRTFTENELDNLKNKMTTFDMFYTRLQDIENLRVTSPTKKMFGYDRVDILPMWVIFNRLYEMGTFFEYEKLSKEQITFGLEYQIATLIQKFKVMYNDDVVPREDELNYYSHKRSFTNKSGQYKTIKSFWKVFLDGHFSKTIDGITWSWTIDKSEYYDWTYKFIDPKSTFSKSIKQQSFDDMNGIDWVDGEDLLLNNSDGHHIVYHKNGGSTTNKKNCAMVKEKYNRSYFNKSDINKSSVGIKELLKSPNTFTDIRRKEWQNGEMVKLEKLEKDIEMYYWPNYVR